MASPELLEELGTLWPYLTEEEILQRVMQGLFGGQGAPGRAPTAPTPAPGGLVPASPPERVLGGGIAPQSLSGLPGPGGQIQLGAFGPSLGLMAPSPRAPMADMGRMAMQDFFIPSPPPILGVVARTGRESGAPMGRSKTTGGSRSAGRRRSRAVRRGRGL